MRSIRLSLVVYFLALLCVALSVASWLLYDTAQRTLRAKEQTALALIDKGYEERELKARQQLDERLYTQAKALAGQVRPRFQWDRIHKEKQLHTATMLGLVGMGTTPRRPLNLPLLAVLSKQHHWNELYGDPKPRDKTSKGSAKFNQGPPILHPLQFQLWRHEIIELALGKDVDLPPEGVASRVETNGWSRPLVPEPRTRQLPNESDFAPEDRLSWQIDDYCTDSGVPLRRVRFRSLITLQDGGRQGPSGFTPPRGSVYWPPPASIIIQVAADMREFDATLEVDRNQRDEKKEALRAETIQSLRHLSDRLLWISGLTFVATALGSLVLVWVGLSPLSRLGEAVSSISPQNFRLDLDRKHLPRELRPIAERLATTLELLRRAFAREKQATADISHELKTPLAAMSTTIDLALRKPRTPEQYREFFADCKLSADTMREIVERLLTLARLDAGVDRLRSQAVNVAELAQQCADVVRPLADARGLRLEISNELPAGELHDLFTDPDKLREVVTNLLHNAIQYNRPQGEIHLKVGRENGSVCVEVADTGIGISPKIRELIFERFYRADPARNADDLHAGLGLAIVKEYVELLGGRISVESQEGQGSTFRVELPVDGPTQAG